MEKNQHNDPLDQYVRRVFDDFEPDPSKQMWGRIEQALDEQEQEKKPFFWRFAAAAAILLLSSGLLYSHLYYSSQIRALEAALKAASQETFANHTAPGESILSAASLPIAPDPTLTSSISQEAPQKQRPVTSSLSKLEPTSNTNESLLPETQPTSTLADLPTLPIKLQPLPNPILTPNRLFLPETPKKTRKDWFIRASFAQPWAKERISRLPNAPGGRPPRWQNSDPHLEIQDFSILAGKTFQSNWGFETGITFRKIEKTSIHRPEFRMRDGRPHSPSFPSPPQFDFSYQLETYAGEAAVTVRVDQQDNGLVNPEEPLALQVASKESLDLIRFPVLGTARMGNGPFQLKAKAGLVGTFIARQQLAIQQSSSQNGRFQPGDPDRAFQIQNASRGTFFMGYVLSAGLEFKPLPRLGFSLEPTLAGDFQRKGAGKSRLPQLQTTGIQLGLVYWM